MLTADVWDIRFMHVISILSDDDESPALDSEDSWNPANSEAESDSVDEEAAEKLQNENRNGTYTLPAGEERRVGSHDTIITAADRNPSPEATRSRRRKRDPSSWKRNVKARKRLYGDEYVGNQGRVHAAIKEGNPCNCRKQCFVKVNAASRAQLRQSYYNLPDFTAQRFFLGNCIKCTKPKRQYAGPNSKRQKTFEYSVSVNAESISVCKQGLASMLGVSIAKINYVCDCIKKQDTPGQDKRGKHQTRPNKISDERRKGVLNFIDNIPKYRSHYTRRHNPNRHYMSPDLTQKKLFDLYVEKNVSLAQEPVTFRMFQEIFATERNYHFGQPSLDTCKTCDSLEMQIKANADGTALQAERELHLRKADAAQSSMKSDF